jgi:hypothetical protein
MNWARVKLYLMNWARANIQLTGPEPIFNELGRSQQSNNWAGTNDHWIKLEPMMDGIRLETMIYEMGLTQYSMNWTGTNDLIGIHLKLKGQLFLLYILMYNWSHFKLLKNFSDLKIWYRLTWRKPFSLRWYNFL